MTKNNVETIDEYIKSWPEDVRVKLEKMRQTIRKAAPESLEEIKWRRPAFSDDERILVMFAAFKRHIGFYTTPSSLKAFEEDLIGFKTGRGSIQFPFDQPLPTELIRKLTAFRIRESKEKGVKWKS